jgi:hypothetical protein
MEAYEITSYEQVRPNLRIRLMDMRSNSQVLQNAIYRPVECGLALVAYMKLPESIADPKTNGINESLLDQDVPWTEIETMKRKGPESNRVFNSLTKDMDPAAMKSTMEKLKAGDQKEFIESIADRKNMIDKQPGREVKEDAEAAREDNIRNEEEKPLQPM